MPVYEYVCEKCKKKVSVFHRKMGESAPLCPECKEAALKRIISRSTFQLKGGGWYVTDYKKK